MSRTNDLRKLMMTMLKEVCNSVYCENADKDEIYPHIVYTISNINLGDLVRNDYIADIDIWDRSESLLQIEELKDKVEDMFRNKNMPCDTILPTFYLVDSIKVNDEDKMIRHRRIRVQIQNYER